jgi:hypothetical protein
MQIQMPPNLGKKKKGGGLSGQTKFTVSPVQTGFGAVTYGLDDLEFEFLQGQEIYLVSKTSRLTVVPSQHPV